MKLKYAIIASLIIWTYLLFDTVVCLSMQVIEDHYRPCYQEKKEEPDLSQLPFHKMTATSYCLTGLTASEKPVREGIVASKPEWIGRQVAIYHLNKDGSLGGFIGYFDVEDTGGDAIQSGRVIDIWMPEYEQCMQFGRRKVAVFLLGEQNETDKEVDLHTKAEAV